MQRLMRRVRHFTHELEKNGVRKMGFKLGPVFMAGLYVVLASCSSTVISSQRVVSCQGGDTSQESSNCSAPKGIAYSLPKGQVQLTASRHAVQPADLAQAQASYAQAAATVAKDQKAVADNQKTKDDDVKKGASSVTLAADDAQVAAAQAQLAADQALADIAKRTLQLLQNSSGKFVETATLTILPPAPDPNARFVTNLDHFGSRDDNIKVSVSNGLLSSSSITSTDQSPAIIQTLADTAIAIAALVGGIPVPSTISTVASQGGFKEIACRGYDIQEIFDPLDDAEVERVKTELATDNSSIDIGIYETPTGTKPAGAGRTLKQSATAISGFVYRIPTRVLVSIAATRTSTGCDLLDVPKGQSIAAIVPDTRTDFVSPADAGSFTTTSLGWTFSNGMLTDYSAQRPSEILAIANVPLNILRDLFKIPTELLQLRVNYDTQAAAAINGETSIRQAQINQMTNIINAETALLQAQINQPTAVAQAQANYVAALQALAKALAAQPAKPTLPTN